MIQRQVAEERFPTPSTIWEEKRSGCRWTQKASIHLSRLTFGQSLEAVAVNHSAGGICIRTRARLKPRSTVYLRTKHCEPPPVHPQGVRELPMIAVAEVRWCEKVTCSDGGSSYLSGLKYFPPEY